MALQRYISMEEKPASKASLGKKHRGVRDQAVARRLKPKEEAKAAGRP
jgi:hypothetical protein